MGKMRFAKQPLSLSAQIDLLKSRGMQVPDRKLAEDTLLRINYYRFSGYALHFEKFYNRERTHQFHTETSFGDVLRIYDFDTQLRVLLFRYFESVEVAFRSAVCYELSILSSDSHWYLDPNRYDPRFDYAKMEEECWRECNRSDEIFISEYLDKYDPPLPPAWMMSEILPIGRWSKIYRHLQDKKAKKAIAINFATNPYHLQSWIHSLTVLRNLCAHHCRIWNRNFTIRPALPTSAQIHVTDNGKLAAFMIILAYLLKPLGKNHVLQKDWDILIAAFPDIPKDKMGFVSSTHTSINL